jgi:predicted cupin superfamily sugar epimerase
VHTLHRGRARYVIIHADEVEGTGDGKQERRVRVESFVVGTNIAAGERMQWIVEGGKYKSCYLLPDEDTDRNLGTDGLLISEVHI